MTETPKDQEMLWEMSRQTEEVPGKTPSDETLRAYQAGGLSDADVNRVEEELVSNPAARRRLAQLAGIGLDDAPNRVRARLFEGEESGPSGRPSIRHSVLGLAASLTLLVALALVGYWLVATGPDSPSGVATASIASAEFNVTVRGAAEDRDRSELAEAYPSTSVRIEVEDVRSQLGPFQVALYREVGGELRRVDSGADVDCYQGACVVSGVARDLVGSSEAGEHTLWILVAAHDFPDSLIPAEVGDEHRLIEQNLKLMVD